MNKTNGSVRLFFLFSFFSSLLRTVARLEEEENVEGHYLLSTHSPSVFVTCRRASLICAAKVSSPFS